MATMETNLNKRKFFIKPKINKVKLVAEEAVLATCKTGLGAYDDCPQSLKCIDGISS